LFALFRLEAADVTVNVAPGHDAVEAFVAEWWQANVAQAIR
jgi:hypothetical protein